MLDAFTLLYVIIYFDFICRCQCGRPTGWHDAQAFDKKVTPNDIWIPSKHTKYLPTDAYGTIEFQGGPHPCKAQVHIIN